MKNNGFARSFWVMVMALAVALTVAGCEDEEETSADAETGVITVSPTSVVAPIFSTRFYNVNRLIS